MTAKMVITVNVITDFCGYETIKKGNQSLAPGGKGDAP